MSSNQNRDCPGKAMADVSGQDEEPNGQLDLVIKQHLESRTDLGRHCFSGVCLEV